ncbi:MAG: PVC-type heme-binding CxxCH protein, partial [Burkholderiales bacterium]
PVGARNANAQKRAEELTGGGKRVSVYDVQPQMWTYERTIEAGTAPYRSFVSIPGHLYENFNRPNYRAILLRGIAWAGKRANVDELLKPDEVGDALRYVEGGPTAPDEAAATIEVHPEFDLSLVAAEPLIRKAMNIDWDARGRLWVSETPEYPNGRRVPTVAPWKESGSLEPTDVTREPEDTISILTDTNGDGRMDRKHVFADKLELVTGFVFYKQGVIAATAPDIWYLADTNGDEVADKRTKLYTGLGIADTHAVINNLRWGLDGWIYATHGYSVGMVTSPDGKKEFGRDGSGVVRFKPDGSAFEQYSSRNGNTWGLDVTWNGQVFWTQPTSGTVFFHTLLPESILAKGRMPGTTSYKGMITGQNTYPAMTWPEQAYVQIDLVGQFTAAAGCAVYDGGAWPDKWRYAYFTGEPTLNIVHQQFVTPDGISYTTAKEPGREQTEFMRSRDLWFRPIETRVGPDGALYVIDFYNQAVIHNDTRGPLHGPANAAVRPDRDHYFGRIWRVQHKQAKKLTVPSLDRANLPALIRVMETHPNAHVKLTAWRLAQENHAGDARLARIDRPMGSKALALYEQARAAKTAAARTKMLDTFAGATDNWTRSAIIAAADNQAPAYLTDAFAYPKSDALIDFVAAVAPGAAPAHASRMLTLAAKGSPQTAALKVPLVRAVARMEGGSITMGPVTTSALKTLLDDADTGAVVLPIIAKWDKAGALRTAAEPRARALLQELGRSSSDEQRRA